MQECYKLMYGREIRTRSDQENVLEHMLVLPFNERVFGISKDKLFRIVQYSFTVFSRETDVFRQVNCIAFPFYL